MGISYSRRRMSQPAFDPEAEQEVDFGRYWRLLAARWWLVAAGLVAGAVVGYALSLGGTQQFKATGIYSDTTTQDIMQHELQHLADLRVSLNEYTSTLALRTFASEASCTKFLEEEKTLFGHTMRNIQRVTVLRRDGERYAERIGDR